MNKKLIRLTESDLHRIVKESVERILAENAENEGLFGNNSNYGEKWYNPMSWKNASQKKQIDADRAVAIRQKFQSALDADKKASDAYARQLERNRLEDERLTRTQGDNINRPRVGYGDTRYGYGNGQEFDTLMR